MEEKEIMEMAKAIMSVESKTHGVSHYVGAGMAIQIVDKLQELGYRKADDLIAENEKLKKENYQLQQKLGECENGYEQTLFLERCKANDIKKETVREIVDVYLYKKITKLETVKVLNNLSLRFGLLQIAKELKDKYGV